MLDSVTHAADEVPGFDGARTSKSDAFVHRVAEQNVRRMMKRVRQDSPTLRGLEARGRIRIVGGTYDMDSGVVPLLA
jgi:carbonic anhydrase